MLGKVYDFLLSRVSPAYHKRRMSAALEKRFSALEPAPHEGNLAGPKNRAVGDYYKTDVYNSAVNSLDPNWITNYKVTGISFHKDSKAASKHEYIVLQTVFPGDSDPFYIRLERTREADISPQPSDGEDPPTEPSGPQKKAEKEKGKKRESVPNSLLSSASVLSGLSKGRYGALDQFQSVDEGEFRKNRIQHFEPRDLVTIFDVAVLARMINTDSPQYVLLKRQCFWFAYMIYEIILKVFKANDSSIEGLVPVSDEQHKVEKNWKAKRGRWIFPINSPSELLRNLEALTDKFEVEIVKAKDEINGKIQARIAEQEQNQRSKREAQEERAKREDAERAAREAERVACEERSKREEMAKEVQRSREKDKEIQRLREELEAMRASQIQVRG